VRKKPHKGVSSNALLTAADKFVLNLLKRAGFDTTENTASLSDGAGSVADPPTSPAAPLPSLDEQVDVLAVITKYLATKHKIAPEPEETDDFFSTAKRALSGGLTPAPNGAENKRRSRKARSDAVAEVIPFGRGPSQPAVSLPADSGDGGVPAPAAASSDAS
jgi:hypothetical protein